VVLMFVNSLPQETLLGFYDESYGRSCLNFDNGRGRHTLRNVPMQSQQAQL
jgi:hypothetical protein